MIATRKFISFYASYNTSTRAPHAKAHATKLIMKEYVHHRHGTIAVTNHVYDLIQKNTKESCPQKSPEWFAKRRNHITASAMAAICKANPYETRLSVLKAKVGYEKEFKGNAATEWGNKYEPEAILKYEQLLNERVIEFGLLESINPNEEFLAGSPDGITASGKLIEVKCPFRRKPTDKIPVYYIYQVQFLLHTLKLKVCDFVQYVPENTWQHETFLVTRIDYDPHFFKAKFKFLRSFWDSVLEIRTRQERNETNILDEREIAAIDFIDNESGEKATIPGDKVVNIPKTKQKPYSPSSSDSKRKTVLKKEENKCLI